MRLRWMAVLPGALVLAGLLVPAPHARADTTSVLPGYRDMVVDQANHRIFVSTGDAIETLDFAGHVLHTITGETGAADLVLDGTTLYVDRAGTSLIDEVDTAADPPSVSGTLTVNEVLNGSLAEAGGLLWFGQGTFCDVNGIYSVDPSDGSEGFFTDPDVILMCPSFAATPVDPDLLFVWTQSGGALAEYDVSSGTPSRVASTTVFPLYDSIAVSPDGTTLTVAGAGDTRELAVSDLTETGVIYPTAESYAVAYSADGSFVAVRPQGGPLVVFPTGSTTPVNQFDSDQLCERNGAPDDLAFSADGSRLFVGGVVFQAISRPTAGMDPSAMTLAADPTPAPPGATVTISGTLAASGAPAAGKSIQLFESSPDGQSRRSLGSVATGLDGAFTKSVVLSAKGDYCFEARWSGDATHPGRARLVSVTIQSFPSALTLSASPGKIFPKDPVTLSGDLSFSGGGPVGGASVGIYRDGPSGPESLIHTSSVDADGHYSFVDHPTELGIYRYRARWAGNAAHDPAQGGYDYLTVRKQRTSLAVTTSRSRITYGSPVRATAHLARHFSNDVVRIYGQVSGGSKTLLKRGRVDADGDISVRVRPGAKAWFWATWAGDRHFFPLTSAKEAVAVRSITRARLLGVDGRSGRYHLYRFTTRCSGPGHRDCPTVVGAVIPNHRGHRLLFDLEVLYRGTWQRVFTVGARIRSNGLAAEIFFYRNRRIIGVPTRVRARFPGDGDHIGSLSRWLYFKVVSALHGRSTPRHGRGGWGAIESFPVTRVDERGSRGPGGGS